MFQTKPFAILPFIYQAHFWTLVNSYYPPLLFGIWQKRNNQDLEFIQDIIFATGFTKAEGLHYLEKMIEESEKLNLVQSMTF